MSELEPESTPVAQRRELSSSLAFYWNRYVFARGRALA